MVRKHWAIPHLSQHVFDSAIGIGDNRDPVALADLVQLFGGAGVNLIPVRGVADAGDELVEDRIVVESDLGEQLGVEHPPEAVVGGAVRDHHAVETILGAAFQIAQVLGIGREPALGERRMNTHAVGEQQRVAHVEEDDFDFRVHGLYCTPLSGMARAGSKSVSRCDPQKPEPPRTRSITKAFVAGVSFVYWSLS